MSLQYYILSSMIVGIDEVGRGPWAGPIVFGAVVLGDTGIDGLTDSKKLTKKRREAFDILIREQASACGLGWVHADELDIVGLAEACRLACRRALEQINVPYSQIIIDGTVNFLKDTGKGPFVTTMKQADLLVPSVSAASIIAKVARDAYMCAQVANYPEYGFNSHVGYGTAAHRTAIERYGVTPLHRLSFAPVARLAQLQQPPVATALRSTVITTKQIGDKAEEVVAQYLKQNGHHIIERNWKTKFCEIDIVSQKDNTIYFTEVKYRKNANQGDGMAAITPRKLRQMKFAAKYFALKHPGNKVSLMLAAASVLGDSFEFQDWLSIEY